MCYRVVCKDCGKFSWGGCGKHLATLYSNIENGMHCACRPWPGVVIPPQSNLVRPQPSASPTITTATATAGARETN